MAKQIGYSIEELHALREYETSQHFTPAVRAALGLADKMTRNMNSVSDADFAELREHYSEPDIIELASTIGMFNYFNRFTAALRIDLSGSNAPYGSFVF